jgi:transposase
VRYAAYKQLTDRQGDGGGGRVTLAFCWSHWRRKFVEIDRAGSAPIAREALERIAAPYAIESRIRGRRAEERRLVRQAESKPLVEALKAWLESKLLAVSEKSVIAEAIRYGLNHWGLVQFLADGRIEMDTNSVERARQPRCGRRQLGLPRPADRDLQAQWRRSAGVSRRCSDQACEPLARGAAGRSFAVGVEGARHDRADRGRARRADQALQRN